MLIRRCGVTHARKKVSMMAGRSAFADPVGEEMAARVRARVDELVAMGYEQMLRERLVNDQSLNDKTRLKFLLL